MLESVGSWYGKVFSHSLVEGPAPVLFWILYRTVAVYLFAGIRRLARLTVLDVVIRKEPCFLKRKELWIYLSFISFSFNDNTV